MAGGAFAVPVVFAPVGLADAGHAVMPQAGPHAASLVLLDVMEHAADPDPDAVQDVGVGVHAAVPEPEHVVDADEVMELVAEAEELMLSVVEAEEAAEAEALAEADEVIEFELDVGPVADAEELALSVAEAEELALSVAEAEEAAEAEALAEADEVMEFELDVGPVAEAEELALSVAEMEEAAEAEALAEAELEEEEAEVELEDGGVEELESLVVDEGAAVDVGGGLLVDGGSCFVVAGGGSSFFDVFFPPPRRPPPPLPFLGSLRSSAISIGAPLITPSRAAIKLSSSLESRLAWRSFIQQRSRITIPLLDRRAKNQSDQGNQHCKAEKGSLVSHFVGIGILLLINLFSK